MVTQDVCQTPYKINYELVKLKLRVSAKIKFWAMTDFD